MKIRRGFVSNSSSSSFVMIYKDINVDEITENDFNNENYKILASTGVYGEGQVMCAVKDQEMFDLLKKVIESENTEGSIEFYKSYYNDCYGREVFDIKKLASLNEDLKIYNEEINQGFITSVEELLELYEDFEIEI
jgi:hypothetical protein